MNLINSIKTIKNQRIMNFLKNASQARIADLSEQTSFTSELLLGWKYG